MTPSRRALLIWGAFIVALVLVIWLAWENDDAGEWSGTAGTGGETTPVESPDLDRPSSAPGSIEPLGAPERAPDQLADLRRGEDRAAGRIVDREGRPVGGAAIWLIPERDTLAWMGLDLSQARAVPVRVPIEQFAHVTSSPDGSFSLSSERRRDGRLITATTSMQEPWLLVLHSGFAPTCIPCGPVGESDESARDIVLSTRAAALSVRVIDDRGEPVAGAETRVRLGHSLYQWSRALGTTAAILDHARIELQSARTSADGRLLLTGLEPGESYVLIEEAAHSSQLIRAIDLVEGETKDLGEVMLPRRRPPLSGRIVDERGEPVAAADVIVADRFVARPEDHVALHQMIVDLGASTWNAHTSIVQSDEEGRFSTGLLDSQSVNVLVLAAGFEPRFVEACVPSAGAVTIRLENLTPFDLTVRDARTGSRIPSARLIGLEHEATGRFLHRLTDRTSSDTSWEDLSGPDAAGGFRIRGGCSVPLLVTVEAPGYATSQSLVPTPPAGDVAIVDLEREGVVVGRAVDSEGRAIDQVEVNLRQPKSGWSENAWKGPPAWHGPTWTGADGSFRIEALGAGEWELTLDAGDRVTMPRVFTLEAGEERALGDVVVPARGTIAGRVVEADGQPGAGFRVTAVPEPPGMRRNRSTTSDAHGRFAFDRLAAGPWKLSAGKSAGNSSKVGVDLAEGQSLEVELRGFHGPRVIGRVLADGQPVADARIAIRKRGGDASSDSDRWEDYDSIGPSGADGSFECEWAGPFEVIAIAPSGGSSRPVLSPSGDDEVVEANLVLADGALGGEVHDSAGAGIAGIELKLYGPWWDGAVETILSDERGRFQFTHVGAHDYRVRCFDPSRVHATVESGPWSIAEGERRIDLAITLPPAASIAVSITHGVGVPAPDGTPVYLFVEGQEQVAQRAQTRDGSCVLDRLLGGSYTVAAGGIGGHYGEMYRSMNPVFADLRLDPGERREIRLDLPRN